MKIVFLLTLIIFTFGYANEPITPIPLHIKINKPKALLGFRLYVDPILSSDKSVSCLSCHNIYTAGGADKHPVSLGVDGKHGNIQSPTIFNARYNFKQFWNARADNLTQQINGPLHNPVEMNMTDTLIEKRLNADKNYKKLFYQVYKTNYITYKEVVDAIVTFEDALVTPNAKFDQFLRGETKLSKEEMRGYIDFKELGCITCHNGVNIGGNMMQKIGIFHPFKNKKTYPDLYSITKNPLYKNVYKVPTLRNIALTAPYFHDGSAKTLKQAVSKMAWYQLGIKLSTTKINDIIAFLKTLTGKMPPILGDIR
jgi:cytochrome c peroxidase